MFICETDGRSGVYLILCRDHLAAGNASSRVSKGARRAAPRLERDVHRGILTIPTQRNPSWVGQPPGNEATILQAILERDGDYFEHEWRTLWLPSIAICMKTDPRSRADFLIRGRGMINE
jgi:hypothetical protein